MAQPVTILSARRSYEYRSDELKLSLLCIRGVVDAIKSNFGFEYGEIVTPNATFGPVANTMPPGLVLALGVTPFPEGQGTAIRSISIDSRRIVVDVAGPSSVIDPTFERLRELVKDLRTTEGASAIPEPHAYRDYTELVTHSPQLLSSLFNPIAIRELSGAIPSVDDSRHELVSAARFRLHPADEEYPGSTDIDARSVNFDIRQGTKVDDGMVFSGAPLHTDDHLELIHRLLTTREVKE